MIIYGKTPDLTKSDGMAYGTVKRRMSFILGRNIIGDRFIVGSDEPVINTTKKIEVIVPPYVSKYTLPFRLGSKRDMTNSVTVYEYE